MVIPPCVLIYLLSAASLYNLSLRCYFLSFNQISNNVKEDLSKALRKYPNKDEVFVRKAFNQMQSKVKEIQTLDNKMKYSALLNTSIQIEIGF